MNDMSIGCPLAVNGADESNALAPLVESGKPAKRCAKGAGASRSKDEGVSHRPGKTPAADPAGETNGASRLSQAERKVDAPAAADDEEQEAASPADTAAPEPDGDAERPEAAEVFGLKTGVRADDVDSGPVPPETDARTISASSNTQLSLEGALALRNAVDKVREQGDNYLYAWRAVGIHLIELREEFPSDAAFSRALKAENIALTRDERSAAVWLARDADDAMLKRIRSQHPGAVEPTSLMRYWRDLKRASAGSKDAAREASDGPTPSEPQAECGDGNPLDDPTGSEKAASDDPTRQQAKERGAPPPSRSADVNAAQHGEALGDCPAPKPTVAREVTAGELDELEALAETLLKRVRALRAAQLP